MEDLRDFQKHKINIYIEYTANLQTHLLDLIFPVSAFVHSFDSLSNLAERHHADIWTTHMHSTRTYTQTHSHFYHLSTKFLCQQKKKKKKQFWKEGEKQLVAD